MSSLTVISNTFSASPDAEVQFLSNIFVLQICCFLKFNIFSGWLCKQGKRVKSWKKRYLIINLIAKTTVVASFCCCFFLVGVF